MIERSREFDLGLDESRIKDKRDAHRQHATVDELLRRFFDPASTKRWEVQLVADEVGMGKTFVALATAYSILAHLRDGKDEGDLGGCYQKVLVVTPPNSALQRKWRREVSEFVQRCVLKEHRKDRAGWFAPAFVERLDELAIELRRRGSSPRVVVANMGIFKAKLRHYDIKRRYLLGMLFRFWGTRFRGEQRERLLRGAPQGWPRDPASIAIFEEKELERIPFFEDEVISALDRLSRRYPRVEKLLELCREIAQPFVRDRDDKFAQVDKHLDRIYRRVAVELIRQDLPLMIVDEAHNWKNGPSTGANGFDKFSQHLLPRTRRALLLTATPFQLRPEEILELLKVSDHLKPCTTEAESEKRRTRLQKHRDDVIQPVLQYSAEASRRFSRAWSRVLQTVDTAQLAVAWASPELSKAREELQRIAAEAGVVDTERMRKLAVAATNHLDPNISELMREGLELFVRNADLSCELGPLVIRHRRGTMHRAFLVGSDYAKAWEELSRRPDRHVLHATPGMDVRGEAELPQYLLMRCVSESKGGKGRSALGSALTGCYSTLLESNEGRSIEKLLCGSDAGKVYFELLRRLVGKKQDQRHPKVTAVADRVVEAWRAGEKTLIFCFRVNTAHRLQEIIDDKIGHELEARRRRCLGGAESLDLLRRRLTGRDRDLVGLGLDRVLWSFYWAAEDRGSVPYQPADLELQSEDLAAVAKVAVAHGVDLDAERPDRVFLHRAVESAIARRLKARKPSGFWMDLLGEIADDQWVARPYGLAAESEDETEGEGERAAFDERGVHTIYEPKDAPRSPGRLRELLKRLEERRDHARATDQAAIIDAYTAGPSLWLGPDPRAMTPDVQGWSAVLAIHRFLAKLTSATAHSFDWRSRALVMQALRRGVLRDSILLRLLPERTELAQQRWGELLAERFLAPLPGQAESMADRVAVFLDDLVAASGDVHNVGDARHSILSATKLRGATFVALVDGSTDAETRERVFAGFNTPLLPEVLICTSVGQEGIDLHRHCRRVVHYDLAWNPAVLEQRTGRADRIGSKTFRERDRSTGPKPFLEIGVPFLAGTYDERMYEEIRLRAQTFEVLTGGELAPDHAEGQDDVPDAEGKSDDRALVELPPEMVGDLRVHRVPSASVRDPGGGAGVAS